ncbi:MAG: helix-turn-helix domain-containing protein [Chloroflexi bacterium]|nr:helix-turn-helix domain-containing protein [Chloroflexota bacterium]
MSGLGKILQDARRRKGLSLDDIERETRVRKRYLLAFEQEDNANLPEPVFAVGFLRVYARFLELDGAELARQYAEETGVPVAATRPMTRSTAPRSTRPYVERRPFPVGAAVLGVMAVAAAVLTYSRLKETPLLAGAQGAAPTAAAGPAARAAEPSPAASPSRGDMVQRTAHITVPENAGGGDRASLNAVASAPRLVMLPPWFLATPDPKAIPVSERRPSMPALIGGMADDARRVLDALSLPVVVEEWASGERPAGVVLWQRPDAGAAADRKQAVVLAVSRGPMRITVPNLVGRPHDEAAQALRQAGLISTPVVRVQGPKDLSPAALTSACNGCVLSVTPPPGAEVSPDGIVAMAVRQD